MPDPQLITLRNGDRVTQVPIEQVPALTGMGWEPESTAAQDEREAADRFADRNSGIGNTILSGIEGAARGITAGGSDVVARLIGGEDTAHAMSERRQAHPWAAGIPNVIGSIAPLAMGDVGGVAGALAEASPAAKIAGLGSKIAASGEGAGLLRSTAATVAGGAAEGALYNAGGYVSDVALGDRKLTADGFVGAMGEGALWGGAASGALKVTSAGLAAARKLLPAAEITADGARTARRAAASEIQASLDDSTTLAAKADSKLADLSAQEEIANPSYKQRVQEIKLQAAQDIADAQVAAARAKQGVAEARGKYAQQTLEGKAAKAAAGKTPKQNVEDFFKGIGTPVNDEAGAIGGASAEDDLLSQLQGTKSRLDSGQSLAEVGAQHAEEPSAAAMEAGAGPHADTSFSFGDGPSAAAMEAGAGKHADTSFDFGDTAPPKAASADNVNEWLSSNAKNPKRVAAGQKAGSRSAELRSDLRSAVKSNLSEDLHVAWDKDGGRFLREEADRIKGIKDPIDAASKISEAFAEKYGSGEQAIFGNEGDRFARRAQLEAEHAESWATAQERRHYESMQAVQDAVHAELAKVNPEAATIQKALVEAKSAKQAMSEWMDKYGENSTVAYDAAGPTARKAKIQDWAKNAPVGDEAGQVAQEHFLGNPERTKMRGGGMEDSQYPKAVRDQANAAGAEAAHRAYLDATASEANVAVSGTDLMARARYASEQAAAKAQANVYDAYHAGISHVPTGDEILASSAAPQEKIEAAIKARPVDFADDLSQTAPMITKHEAAHADLAEALGVDAPQGSAERAQEFRAAQSAAQEKAAVQTANAADQLEKAPQATKSLAGQLLGRATDMGTTYEALRMMGVPLPDPGKIPVIGKVLSAYLKAKLLGKAFGGHAGGIASSAETTIAAKSAAIRQRVYKAADAMLDGGAKVTGKLSEIGGGPAAVLSRQLFDKQPKAPVMPNVALPPKDSIGALYLARAAEVNAAMKPGAVADAVKARVNTSDPEALAEIIGTHMRKLQVVADAMPRPSGPPALIDGTPWLPSKADLAKWTRVIAAVENPANVFERAATGTASMAEIDAVRQVYPSLYADGQARIMSQVANGDVGKLTTWAKAAISRTWDIPVSHMSRPDVAAFMQAGYQPQPVQVTPPGAPTISGPMNLGTRTMPRLDRGG